MSLYILIFYIFFKIIINPYQLEQDQEKKDKISKMGSTVPGSSNNNKEQRRAAALVSDCSPSRFSWSFAVHPRGCIFSGAPVLRTI